MDKFKNLFTDEEFIEEEEDNDPIEIKEIKKEEEHKLPTFMREKIEKEEAEKEHRLSKEEKLQTNDIEIKELKLETNKPEELPSIKKVEEKKSFKFPIDLTDNDFIETRSRQSLHTQEKIELQKKEVPVRREVVPKKEPKVSELYKDKKEEVKPKRQFTATPIISPIYGILDKNYTPGDMECSKGENLEHHRHSKSVDFDSVRKKAYGNLTTEIKENLMCENCEYLKEAKECQREKMKKDSLLYNLNTNTQEDPYEPEYNNITLDEATENYYDYGVEYQKQEELPQEEIKIVNHETEEVHSKKEIPPVKSSINLLSTLKKSMGEEPTKPSQPEKNLELTDDLFNLIDSMYDERNETSD